MANHGTHIVELALATYRRRARTSATDDISKKIKYHNSFIANITRYNFSLIRKKYFLYSNTLSYIAQICSHCAVHSHRYRRDSIRLRAPMIGQFFFFFFNNSLIKRKGILFRKKISLKITSCSHIFETSCIYVNVTMNTTAYNLQHHN